MDQGCIVTALWLNVGGKQGTSIWRRQWADHNTSHSDCVFPYITPSMFIGRVPLLVFRLKCVLQTQPLAKEC